MSRKKILIAVLDWGIGHASRCIPLIRQLIEAGHIVHLASNGKSAALLHDTFPDLRLDTSIPDYNIRYPSKVSFALYFLWKSPKIFRIIRQEHAWLERMMQLEHYDEVFSDNRYGLHTAHTTCHLITHQLHIRAHALVKPLIARWTQSFINRFDDCLIPDFEGPDNLSGELSHPPTSGLNVRYIGPLSRFQTAANQEDNRHYIYTGIVSGPEPHSSVFEDLLLRIFIETGESCLLICGSPDKKIDEMVGAVRKVSHLHEKEFGAAISSSKFIVCRSGYSTIMDLHFLDKKALLVPTPGQTEQEYLARYHASKGSHAFIEQQTLNLSNLMTLSPKN